MKRSAPGPAMPPCKACHGPDLRGMGNMPPIAGRQASYLARQIWDFKLGARDGQMAALMKSAYSNSLNTSRRAAMIELLPHRGGFVAGPHDAVPSTC